MAPDSPRCPDWVYSNNSNVHVSKDREWFTDYTPFKTRLGDIYGMMSSDGLQAIGIGTVELPTKRSPNRTGTDAHGTLRLTNVLHAPGAICNIIGGPISDDHSVIIGGNSTVSSGSIKDGQGRPVAYFEGSRPLPIVKLRGPPVGPRVIKPGEMYMINVRWDAAERDRWEEHQISLAASYDGYTDEEKKWLKNHFKSEFYFLRIHGLNIYKDEDREEGREILRAFMRQEEDEDEDGDGDGESLDDDSDLDGHFTDYHFSERQLSFIEKEYGNSMNFMYSYGLKFYDDDDCEEAKAIVKGIMAHD